MFQRQPRYGEASALLEEVRVPFREDGVYCQFIGHELQYSTCLVKVRVESPDPGDRVGLIDHETQAGNPVLVLDIEQGRILGLTVFVDSLIRKSYGFG
jgi:hypothetical protein